MTTQSEIDTILSEFDVLLVKLHGFREVIAIVPPDGLKALHKDWITLNNLGNEVSYLAERLDLDYQRQFIEQEGRDVTPTDDDDIEPSDPDDLATPPWLADEHETTEDSQARDGEW